ncbi:MAG TPA: glycosyltransferase family 87 protein [Pseudonocardiaceae bacterium]|nr:glycosyltransferase family 87 protein [Pseudonocardiaceae bacterium]
MFARPAKYQWDFGTYFYASQLFTKGQDPYDFEALVRLGTSSGAHGDKLNPFIYPVHALLWFLPLGELSYHAAYYVYLALKIAAGIILLIVAREWINGPWWRALTPIFALLMFGGAVPSDLRTGNVALFEATLVLVSFALLQRGRPGAFTFFIVLASSFKTALLPLMTAPLVVRARRRWLATTVAASALPILLLISWFAAPGLSRSFLHASGGLVDGLRPRAPRGALNASSLRILADICYLVGGNANLLATGICYVAWVLVILSLGVYAWYKFDCDDRVLVRNEPVALMYLLLTYGLLVPRLTQYSYTIMIIPCMFALCRARRRWLTWAIVCFACVPFYFIRRDLFNVDPLSPAVSFALLPLEYSNFLVLLACWSLMTFAPRSTCVRATARNPATRT